MVKKNLYFAQVHSHISYTLLVWGPMCSKQKLNKLQKLQNQCLRLIINKKHIDTHTYRDLKILNIDKSIQLALCKMGYKLLKRDSLIRVIDCLSTNIHNISLNRNHHYNMQSKHIPSYSKSTHTKYSNSFLHQCIKQYSALPVATRNKVNLQLFVTTLKRDLLDS